MKVYLVEADFGQWEDSYQVTLGVFMHKKRAENVKKDYEDLMIFLKNSDEPECPNFPQPIYPEDTGPEWNEYYEKSQERSDAENFNFCNIVEYELDKRKS
jgi:hypothetical protein